MRNYRRYYIPNSAVFITCVTHKRFPFFSNPQNIDLLQCTICNVQKLYPFTIIAHILLPDHFHWIIQLPGDEPNFSRIMQSLKWNFTRNYKKANSPNSSEPIWQRGFWDHIIRDNKDFSIHLDYIHWNPVKHGLVLEPGDWLFSSFSDWIKEGYYPPGKETRIKVDQLQNLNFE